MIGLQYLLNTIIISGASPTILLICELSIIYPSRDIANSSISLLKCLELMRDTKTILILICINFVGLVCPYI
jgi:hypothetical protein